MTKTLEKYTNLINIFLHSLILYTILLRINYSFSEEINYFLPIIVLPILLLIYYAKLKVNKFILLLTAHIALILISIIIPINTNFKILLILIILGKLFFSKGYFYNKDKKPIVSSSLLIYELIFIVIYISSLNINKLFRSIILICGLVYLIGYYLVKYMLGIKEYIKYNSYLTYFPIKNILKINNYCLLLFFIIGIILTIAVTLLKLDNYLLILISPIINLCLSLLSKINLNPRYYEPPDSHNDELLFGSTSYISNTNSNPTFINTITIIFFIIALFFIIKALVNYIKNMQRKVNLASDEISSLNNNENISLFNLKSTLTFDNSPNGKIRKYYYKKIMKLKKNIKSINKTLTHIEISNEVEKNSNENINTLTSIYEKARYSNNPCTKDEVTKAKKL